MDALPALKVLTRVDNLVNRTTRVEIHGGKRYFGEKEEKDHPPAQLEFVEFLDGDRVRIDVPPRTCSRGHRLEADIEFVTPLEKLTLHVEGLVEAAEHFDNHHDSISVRLTHYDKDTWYKVQKLFKQRQTHVAELFARLKGAEK